MMFEVWSEIDADLFDADQSGGSRRRYAQLKRDLEKTGCPLIPMLEAADAVEKEHAAMRMVKDYGRVHRNGKNVYLTRVQWEGIDLELTYKGVPIEIVNPLI